ncbi:MAG: class I SAM-dependent methyltransferase [bacterium]|nr:class I SAM-dependent methyltransferase [bacterium]
MIDDIQDNIAKHNRIASEYDHRHPEIYNQIEQERLLSAVNTCVKYTEQDPSLLRVLDYGCGAGNLSRIFLNLGCTVTAADVAPAFLEVVRQRTGYAPNLITIPLNGKNLDGVEDDSFDIVALYSVLHHIPDYLTAVAECIRVLRRGGILFIDHEHNGEKWAPSPSLLAYRHLTTRRNTVSYYLRSLLSPRWYVKKFNKLRNPRYQDEGDIHVWPDDHIEWEALKAMTEGLSVEAVVYADYLGYEPGVNPFIYDAYRMKCSDMKLYMGRKQ